MIEKGRSRADWIPVTRAQLLLILCSLPAFPGATITIINTDSPGVGFNDPTPVAPVGGNSGTTRGEQRIIAFERAAEVWGQTIESDVEILVEASFADLPCSAGSATLGQAGTNQVFRDFAGATFTNTWYPAALANKLAGTDLGPGVADMSAAFNGDIDGNNNCLSGTNWYYGLDHSEGGDIDFLATVLHELGHGLGFANFVDESSGSLFLGRPDVYTKFTLDNSTGKHWDEMNSAERSASATNCDHVVWDGGQVTADAPSALTLGVPNFSVHSPPVVAGDYRLGPAPGADLSSDVTANVELVNDGVGNTADGCDSVIGFTPGNIALMDFAEPADCSVVTQLVNVIAASPAAMLVVDNEAGCPVPNLPVLFNASLPPGAMITQGLGDVLKGQLPTPGVVATLGIDGTRLAGVDSNGFVQLFATDPVQPGSSISHFDTLATPSLLMEPAITSGLTDNLDLTPSLMADIGWTLVSGMADLSVGKSDDPDPVIAGSTLTYTVTVNNAGPDDAVNVEASDTLPGGVTFVSTSGCAEDPGGIPTCGLGTIASGASKMYTITVTIDEATLGSITNNVSVASAAMDPNPLDDTASEDTLVTENQPPTALSVTPPSGSGSSQTFTYLFSDPNGAADVRVAQMIINTSPSSLNSCRIYYDQPSNRLHLMNDTATGWLGPLTPGVAGNVQNSQCALDAGGSLVSAAGNNLTAAVALTFKPSFVGTKTTYGLARDTADQTMGWQPLGAWTVPNQPPTALSVTPPSGSGSSQTFTYLFSDPNGAADVRVAQMIINTSPSSLNSCRIYYDQPSNRLHLMNDTATGWLGPLTPGVAGSVQNSQCVLDAGGSSLSAAGNNLTAAVALTFKPSFAGTKITYGLARDTADQTMGWQPLGAWTVPNQPPTALSVTPPSGSGSIQTFSYLFSDPNGAADVRVAQMIINTSPSSLNSCRIYYDQPSNRLHLMNDTATGWLGPLTPGVAGSVQNSQCVLDAAGSSLSAAGNNLTAAVALTFKPSFVGTKITYGLARDTADQTMGWQPLGAWTVPNQPPTALSVTPPSGSGSSQTFTYLFSDPNGAADVRVAQMIINTSPSSLNSCRIYYDQPSNRLHLMNDTATGWLGPLTPGVAGSVQNSQCVLDAGGSSVSAAGNNLTAAVALTFKPSFVGTKTTYGLARDTADQTMGWQPLGAWTVP